MADIVNERVDLAQQELQKRAERLKQIVAANKGKSLGPGFTEGIKLVSKMIEDNSKLIDTLIFDAPKTALEQHRNLMLVTGNMSQTVAKGMKSTTDAIDGMLHALEEMSRSR